MCGILPFRKRYLHPVRGSSVTDVSAAFRQDHQHIRHDLHARIRSGYGDRRFVGAADIQHDFAACDLSCLHIEHAFERLQISAGLIDQCREAAIAVDQCAVLHHEYGPVFRVLRRSVHGAADDVKLMAVLIRLQPDRSLDLPALRRHVVLDLHHPLFAVRFGVGVRYGSVLRHQHQAAAFAVAEVIRVVVQPGPVGSSQAVRGDKHIAGKFHQIGTCAFAEFSLQQSAAIHRVLRVDLLLRAVSRDILQRPVSLFESGLHSRIRFLSRSRCRSRFCILSLSRCRSGFCILSLSRCRSGSFLRLLQSGLIHPECSVRKHVRDDHVIAVQEDERSFRKRSLLPFLHSEVIRRQSELFRCDLSDRLFIHRVAVNNPGEAVDDRVAVIVARRGEI